MARILRQTYETCKPLISCGPRFVSKLTVCETRGLLLRDSSTLRRQGEADTRANPFPNGLVQPQPDRSLLSLESFPESALSEFESSRFPSGRSSGYSGARRPPPRRELFN